MVKKCTSYYKGMDLLKFIRANVKYAGIVEVVERLSYITVHHTHTTKLKELRREYVLFNASKLTPFTIVVTIIVVI
jgi:hypothetical protein